MILQAQQHARRLAVRFSRSIPDAKANLNAHSTETFAEGSTHKSRHKNRVLERGR